MGSTRLCQPARGVEWSLKGPLRLRLGDDSQPGWGIIRQVSERTPNLLALCVLCPQREEYMGLGNNVTIGVAVFIITVSD